MNRVKRIAIVVLTEVVIVVGTVCFAVLGLMAVIVGGACSIAQHLCDRAFGHAMEGLVQLHNLGRRANARLHRPPAVTPDDRARRVGL